MHARLWSASGYPRLVSRTSIAIDPPERYWPSRRRLLRGGGGMLAAAIAGLALVFASIWSLWYFSWPHQEPLGNPEFGINFSCNYAEYLLLENGDDYVSDDRPDRAQWCAATLGELIEATGARHLRISVEWSQVQPAQGAYDFRLVDALLAEAHARGAKVLLTVGVKAQRHPEYYIPDWVLDRLDAEATRQDIPGLGEAEYISEDPHLRSAAVAMVAAVVAHTWSSPAIEAWGADNEPYVRSSRGLGWEDWSLSSEFIREEIAVIRANDPAARPVSVNHGQHFVFDRRWRYAIEDSDVLGVSIYPFRNDNIFGRRIVIPILEIGPLAPNYAHQGRTARAAGKQFWITEMQGEPWFTTDPRTVGPENPSPNLSPAKFRKSIEYARRSGASRVYLWGAEWWLMERERFGDDTWLKIAREAIPGGPASQTAASP